MEIYKFVGLYFLYTFWLSPIFFFRKCESPKISLREKNTSGVVRIKDLKWK
jgi:hypothetical protein